MDERRKDRKFASSKELLEYLREYTDDIESVVIPINAAPLLSRNAKGGPKIYKGVGAQLKLCSGDFILIGREDAAMLINDGVLQRLKIKCVLDPVDGS